MILPIQFVLVDLLVPVSVLMTVVYVAILRKVLDHCLEEGNQLYNLGCCQCLVYWKYPERVLPFCFFISGGLIIILGSFFCWDNKLDNVTVASFSRFESDELLGNLTVVYHAIILKNIAC